MERRLIVMRHAKSSWKDAALPDHERPLNKRGRVDAPRVGQRLAELGWVPLRVLSSTSRRTRETWDLARGALHPEPPATFLQELYHGDATDVERALAELPDEVGSALVLGHNPGWEYLVARLCGAHHRLTTANAALLSVAGATWSEALQAAPGWRLHQVVRPKEL